MHCLDDVIFDPSMCWLQVTTRYRQLSLGSLYFPNPPILRNVVRFPCYWASSQIISWGNLGQFQLSLALCQKVVFCLCF